MEKGKLTFDKSMDILNKEQLAEYIKVKAGTVSWLIRSRQIPLIRLNKRSFCFDKADVDKWLQKRKESVFLPSLCRGKCRENG